MAHQALYREWRPKVFDEVVEQKHVVLALRQSVISGQIAHAYLFSGTRGTGKTTLAKIFARAINCLQPENGNPCNRCAICRGMLDGSLLDVIEMDAASNNSVDNIRRLCDEIVFMPAQARFKVYIIDEVHMLSAGAFNALLKTLEEPPAHAVFILATTEPHRIPATILSRCQRYEFRRLPVASMAARLSEIAASGGIEADPEALETIASLADGALRDAISLLDQARATFPGRIGRDDVLSLAGVAQDQFMQQMAEALLGSDVPGLLSLVDQLVMAGRDLSRFVTDLAQHLRNILVCKVSVSPQQLIQANRGALAAMKKMAGRVAVQPLLDLIRGLAALQGDLRWASDARTALEIGLIRLMSEAPAAAAAPAAATPVAVAPAAATPVAADPLDLVPANGKPVPVEEEAAADPPEIEADSQEKDAAAGLWQQMLQALACEGQMTLFLFGRPARPQFCGKTLRLAFGAADQINCREIGSPAAIKVLRDLASRFSGESLDVQVTLAEEGAGAAACASVPAADDWIGKIRRTADTLGIPVKMEE